MFGSTGRGGGIVVPNWEPYAAILILSKTLVDIGDYTQHVDFTHPILFLISVIAQLLLEATPL